jgi:Ser-tRNA(Ala) deacylase AlaX
MWKRFILHWALVDAIGESRRSAHRFAAPKAPLTPDLLGKTVAVAIDGDPRYDLNRSRSIYSIFLRVYPKAGGYASKKTRVRNQ